MAALLINATGANTATGPGGAATTSAVDTTHATLIVLAVAAYYVAFAGPPAGVAPTDSAGNTWTPLTAHGNYGGVRIWYTSSPVTSATHTFTSTASPSDETAYQSIGVAVFSGTLASTTADFDVGAQALQPGSGTPSVNNELVVSAVTLVGVGGTTAIDSGFTVAVAEVGTATAIGVAIGYLVQTTAVAVNPTWSGTATSGGSNSASAMTAFQSAAAPAPPSPGAQPWQMQPLVPIFPNVPVGA